MITINLPQIINKYVEASNQHDVKSILSCFSDNALVHDERAELHGNKAIEGWIVQTIEKYKFHFQPLGIKASDGDCVVAVEVSGNFEGSPIILDYHFTIQNDKILSLTIG